MKKAGLQKTWSPGHGVALPFVAASVDGEDAGGRVVGAPRRRHSGRSLTAFTALCDISRPAGSPRPQAVRPSWAPGHCQPPTAGLPAERGHGLLVGWIC